MANLDPTGGTILLGDLVLRTSNLVGEANEVPPEAGEGLRAADGQPSPLEEGLAEAGMITTHVVEISAQEIDGGGGPGPAGPSRGGASDSATIEVEVPAPGPETGQAVVTIDERGVTTWSFAEAGADAGTVRAGATRTFVITRPKPAPPQPGEAADRGLFDGIGKQLLKVVTFPIGSGVGRVLNSFIEDWEVKHQGYGVRDYHGSNYTADAPYFDGEPAKWQALSQGRTLLMIHGTFSRAKGAFNELPLGHMQELERLYEGRVIAFDHLSVSQSPRENMEWLVGKIPAGTSLDVDVVCHSRGGLVARSLTEWDSAFPDGRDVRVHRTALVGTVNNGTILADVHHWRGLVDTLSTVLNTVGINLPAPADLILSLVKDIAEAAYPQLRGLECMVPYGTFLTAFNARGPRLSEYLAIASNYEPVDGRIRSYVDDAVRDLLFEGNDNDMMVRTDSVLGSTVPGGFQPVTQSMVLDKAQGIEHSRYFGNPAVADKLVSWLGEGLR